MSQFFLSFLFSFLPLTAKAAIYGNSSFKTASYLSGHPAVATQISSFQLKNDQNRQFVSFRPLSMRGLCTDEPWANFRSLGTCTGFFISPNQILTAGHCMIMPNACANSYWILPESPFEKMKESQRGYLEVESNTLYSCKRIIQMHYDPHFESGLDYALVELNQPLATHRAPISIQKDGVESIIEGQEVFALSYPLGTSLKTSSGFVRKQDTDLNIGVSTLDLMRGSSGAPVFSESTGKLLGLVARGERDYEDDSVNVCHRLKFCSTQGCRGEDIIPITSILKDLEKAKVQEE